MLATRSRPPAGSPVFVAMMFLEACRAQVHGASNLNLTVKAPDTTFGALWENSNSINCNTTYFDSFPAIDALSQGEGPGGIALFGPRFMGTTAFVNNSDNMVSGLRDIFCDTFDLWDKLVATFRPYRS